MRYKSIAVIGTQWGDEGKGKITDCLSKKADFVVRFQGGNNAGHTVVNKFGTFKLHLVPCGVFYPQTKVVIGNGVVIDPATLLEEISDLKKAGIKLENRLFISPRAHIIMPYHRILDALYEKHKGKKKTGTTGRGIGPVYADKVTYMGIRCLDLLDIKILKSKLSMYLPIKNKIIKALGGKSLPLATMVKTYNQYGNSMKKYIKDPFPILNNASQSGKTIIYEGAQGLLLDNDWGTYPFVTASSLIPGSIQASIGTSSKMLKRVIGVTKAYTTRVGAGQMPTELNNKQGEKLRTIGNEYGATTGRPRRCGWFDVEIVKYSSKVCHLTELALTKLDVLSAFKKIRICVGYLLDSRKVSFEQLSNHQLDRVKPIYQEVPGWNSQIQNIKSFGSLPQKCQSYVQTLEKLSGLPIRFISVGPERRAIITKKVS